MAVKIARNVTSNAITDNTCDFKLIISYRFVRDNSLFLS